MALWLHEALDLQHPARDPGLLTRKGIANGLGRNYDAIRRALDKTTYFAEVEGSHPRRYQLLPLGEGLARDLMRRRDFRHPSSSGTGLTLQELRAETGWRGPLAALAARIGSDGVASLNDRPVPVTRTSLQKSGLQRLEALGVTDAVLDLEGSRFGPRQCMAEARRQLDFMGLAGARWVSNVNDRDEFITYLDGLGTRGRVRMLLMDPGSQGWSRLKTERSGRVPSREPLDAFVGIMRDHRCLEVRLYATSPRFRLVFIDDEELAVSRYPVDCDGVTRIGAGTKAPHLVVRKGPEWSLYAPFRGLFEDEWARASPIA